MNLSELQGGEANPIYQQVEAANSALHYGFLSTMIQASIDSNKPWLSESLIKAINFHAIVGLHDQAGHYRSVEVAVNNHLPPQSYRVASLMEDFVNDVNRYWETATPIDLAAYALWRLNYIHPFVNGNGRTARAICYYIICVKVGGLLPGTPILPELLRQGPTRTEYVQGLQMANGGDLGPLTALVRRLITQQLQ